VHRFSPRGSMAAAVSEIRRFAPSSLRPIAG
jgi:hypothetical protein